MFQLVPLTADKADRLIFEFDSPLDDLFFIHDAHLIFLERDPVSGHLKPVQDVSFRPHLVVQFPVRRERASKQKSPSSLEHRRGTIAASTFRVLKEKAFRPPVKRIFFEHDNLS